MHKAAEGRYRFDNRVLAPDAIFRRMTGMFSEPEEHGSATIFPFRSIVVKKGYPLRAGVELEATTSMYRYTRPGELTKWKPEHCAFSVKLFLKGHARAQRKRCYDLYEFKADLDGDNIPVMRLRVEHRDYALSKGIVSALLCLMRPDPATPEDDVRLILEKIPYNTDQSYSGEVVEVEKVSASDPPSWESGSRTSHD